MISAVHVTEEIDAGDIYLKMPLSLEGSADKIFKKAARIIFGRMIPEFLSSNLHARPQIGNVVHFERRKPEQSELLPEIPLDWIYDYIRMLDAEGYPNAFIRFGPYRFEFTQALYDGEQLSAHVRIQEEKEWERF